MSKITTIENNLHVEGKLCMWPDNTGCVDEKLKVAVGRSDFKKGHQLYCVLWHAIECILPAWITNGPPQKHIGPNSGGGVQTFRDVLCM